MSMAWLCLPAFTVLLVGCFHTAVTESDVTPRLTFTYSKFYLDHRITTASQYLLSLCGLSLSGKVRWNL